MAEITDKANPWDRENDQSILEIFHIATGKRKVVAEFDYLIEAPNWSRDGGSLIYNSKGKIFRLELSSGAINEIFTDYVADCNNDHVLSPDGHSVAVSHQAREDGKSRIYTVPLSGGVPRLITALAPSYLHGWSPDGNTLAYCAERNGEFDIYAIPVNGGEETRLTDAPGLSDGPEYDPSGNYIWFNSVRSGLMQVWRMRADGSEQTQMTFDENWNTWFPHVSPDGKQIVMLAYKKGDLLPHEHVPHKNVELRLMSSEGGDVTTVIQLFGGQGTINVNSWSPDSKSFAFVRYRIKGEETE